ncbi:hypothetical protein AMTR_s00012p00055830 [Amborella trichopoda]|uniref:Myb/SANT-like domain-containing protein n=1 Tax=Amborella trichopoda TaxID=13333 RepID=W1PJ32_AMBTC|nr:hypothetical protein AMTR_s00012p00055830 [Amborella trichopoda]
MANIEEVGVGGKMRMTARKISIWYGVGHNENGEEKKGKEKEKTDNNRKNLMWTYEMDNCLMNQVLKQVHLGRRVQHGFRCENGFRREAYTEICDEFEKVTGIVLTLESIKNRMKTWERQYDQVIVMVCESGFGWDDKLQKVTTLEEQWSEYLKV